MGSLVTLPLSNVVDVSVSVSPSNPATPTFNQGLIVGTSSIIGSVTGANPRIRQYTTLQAMIADGFTTASPEYIAASIYFSQNAQGPAPIFLWVGRQDLTAIQTLTLGGTPGTLYAVGDLFGVTQGGAQLGVGVVTAVNAGVVTGVSVVAGRQGTAYAIANNLATTVISGVGDGTLTVDITAIGETPLQAVQACRLASPNWYVCIALAATDADSIAIGEWAQAITPQSVYFYTTQSANALTGAVGNVFSTLKAGSYSRALGIYSTVQGGLAPNNIYAAAAAMGVAMGLNTGLNNSYYTLKFKQLVGITTEPLTQTQVNTIEGNNGNVYVNYAESYQWIEQGTVASGSFFDQILNLDMLASDMQYSCVDLLVDNPAILQTQSGQSQILNAINGACSRAAARGFISGGIWEGLTLSGNGLNLTDGMSLNNGYLAQSPVYSSQAPADRTARKSMPVYVAIIESGAVHSILIGVFVQQ